MLVKIVEDFYSAEGWQVGDVVDMTNPETLLREGKVVLAKKSGTEETVDMDNSGTTYQGDSELICPVCGFVAKSAAGLSAHMRKHK